MSISSSAIASLVIAGTAIGGSAIAVVVNHAPTDSNSTNISQVIDPNVMPTNPVDPNATIETVIPTTAPTKQVVTPKPVLTPTPPPSYGGSDDGDDQGSDDGDLFNGDDDGNYGDHHDGGHDDEGDDD